MALIEAFAAFAFGVALTVYVMTRISGATRDPSDRQLT